MADRRRPYKRAIEKHLLGLCLSGGGIRSATFNLGVLQGLAEKKLLPSIDYLSTVSGGGFIGGWLTAWIQRMGLGKVEADIASNVDPKHERARPVRFLRQYSCYLAPQSGLLSADLWTMVSVFLRNLVLNQSVILLALCAVLAIPFLGLAPIVLVREWRGAVPAAIQAAVAGALLLWYASWGARSAIADQGLDGRWGQPKVLKSIVFPVLASAVLFSAAMWGAEVNAKSYVGWEAGVAGAIVLVALYFPHFASDWHVPYNPVGNPAPTDKMRHFGLLFGSAAVSVALALIPIYTMKEWSQDTFRNDWLAVVFGPPLVLLFYSLTTIFHCGITGRRLIDGRREWWGRISSWTGILCGVWMAVASIAVFGPPWIYYLHATARITLGSIWAAVSAAGTKLASGSKTTGEANGPPDPAKIAREAIVTIAPYVFIAGLLVLLATGLQWVLVSINNAWSAYDKAAEGWPIQGWISVAGSLLILSFRDRQYKRWRYGPPIAAAVWFLATAYPWISNLPLLVSAPQDYGEMFGHYWPSMNLYPAVVLPVLAILVVVTPLLSWRIDVNEFSMHHFYRNRLVRAYLGASQERAVRSPNPFTGFDERDDVSLDRFLTRYSYAGPLPVLNATLNVSRGDDLATQERKGESFGFTPLRTGFDYFRRQLNASRKAIRQYGYRSTSWNFFGDDGGLRIGTAVAISGAAASPNSGYHSKPAVAFLLSLFNVRLGWWMRNPAIPADPGEPPRPSPPQGLFYLLSELAGYADNGSRYVNLTDGGHFENMGLYELVRRRCRYIIVSDAEQDGGFDFQGIGSAIRKCRTDFGVEIDLRPGPIVPAADGKSTSRCAVGTIRYREMPGEKGYILYLKAAITGDESTDIYEYRKRAPEFPHQTTADQFFNESQFESYRQLGYQTVSRIFQKADFTNDVPDLFKKLAAIWPAKPLDPDAKLRFDSALWHDFTQATNAQKLALIYRAFEDLGLGSGAAQDDHPGLIALYREWKNARGTLMPRAGEFSAEFIDFFTRL